MEKKKILSTLCAGAFLLGMAVPVMDFAPEAVQSSAFGNLFHSKCCFMTAF